MKRKKSANDQEVPERLKALLELLADLVVKSWLSNKPLEVRRLKKKPAKKGSTKVTRRRRR